MKPYELKRFYHSKLGKFVYKYKGSGIIEWLGAGLTWVTFSGEG